MVSMVTSHPVTRYRAFQFAKFCAPRAIKAPHAAPGGCQLHDWRLVSEYVGGPAGPAERPSLAAAGLPAKASAAVPRGGRPCRRASFEGRRPDRCTGQQHQNRGTGRDQRGADAHGRSARPRGKLPAARPAGLDDRARCSEPGVRRTAARDDAPASRAGSLLWRQRLCRAGEGRRLRRGRAQPKGCNNGGVLSRARQPDRQPYRHHEDIRDTQARPSRRSSDGPCAVPRPQHDADLLLDAGRLHQRQWLHVCAPWVDG